jgi:hypothetical protein
MLLHFLLASAQASSFYIKPFPEFIQEANFIVHGTLSNIHAEHGISDSGAKIIYTFANLDIKEVLKGSISKQSIVIREVGGSKDGYTIDIPGTPELKEGEDTVLFLGAEKSDQSYEINGLELGQYNLQQKDGQEILSGGIFNYAKHDEHNLAQEEPENQRPWSLKEVRSLVEKQGGKDALPKPASTPMTRAQADLADKAKISDSSSQFSNSDSSSEASSQAKDHSESESSPFGPLAWVTLGLLASAALFFLFRKR